MTYGEAVATAYNPTQTGFTLSDAWDTLTKDGIFGVFGYVSPSHKEELVATEAANLVKASAGTMADADARAIASDDVGNVLRQAGADPTQAPDWLEKLEYAAKVALVILALYVGFKVVSAFK